MEFEHFTQQLTEKISNEPFINATISQPRVKSEGLKRVRLKPVSLRDTLYIQFEYQYERVLNHRNIPIEHIGEEIEALATSFRQVHAEFEHEVVHVQISKKYKVLWKSSVATTKKEVNLSHNRKKNYLLAEDTPYPFLIRLGVQTKDGKVRKQHFDKFRQINRFVEFIDDALIHLPKDRPIRIIDFGSGKSYLTFALYHYLHIEKGLDIRVTGLDLKKEVIEECQQIARDLDYKHLEFLVGDIHDYQEAQPVDMVVTLHACDVATDMALGRAVKWDAKVILSVPCCQHELFSQIEAPQLDIMLQHGLIKERFAALATDAIRAELLTMVGYETQLLEFIDMENTPKNILIRAYQTGKKPTAEMRTRYEQFRSNLHVQPYLEKELKGLLD